MSRDFNGSSQYLSTTTLPVSGPPFTVAGWLKVTASTAGDVWGLSNSSGYDFYRLTTDFGPSDGNIYGRAYGCGSAIASVNPLADTWQHVLFICSSTTSRTIVINGNWAGRGTNTDTDAVTTLDKMYLGAADNDAGVTLSYATAQLAHWAVWSSALGQTDAESLAGPFSSNVQSGSGANPLAIQAASLVAYWPIGGSTSPEPDDKGSNDLTLTGSPGTGGSDPTVDAPPSSVSIPVIMHHLQQQGIR